ncbi:HNH endonuclease [Exiguobacterium sp. R-17]|uniref:HNH endonuclease n=1 Tax=Exiguobacterium sp. R-17 TaxID=3404054 RepID=UPI003CEEAD94
MNNFTEFNPSLESYFRSIILFGRNVASYKFAMAKSLLELNQHQKDTFISLEDVSVSFAHHVCEHLKISDRQATSSSSKFLDVCRNYNAGNVSHEQLIDATRRLGFVNVLDAFHNVNNEKLPVSFFEVQKHGNTKGIVLTDDMYNILQSVQMENFSLEVEARWRLVETAWGLNIAPSLLNVKHDAIKEQFFIQETDRNRRIDITSSRDALNGYQKGKCFYCFRDISIQSGDLNLADVDHFIPHILGTEFEEDLNGVWNLVLACHSCNRGSNGKFARIPSLEYLERLHRRNEFFIESHHPLRETLLNQTGVSTDSRIKYLQLMYNLSISLTGGFRWKPTIEFAASF